MNRPQNIKYDDNIHLFFPLVPFHDTSRNVQSKRQYFSPQLHEKLLMNLLKTLGSQSDTTIITSTTITSTSIENLTHNKEMISKQPLSPEEHFEHFWLTVDQIRKEIRESGGITDKEIDRLVRESRKRRRQRDAK